MTSPTKRKAEETTKAKKWIEVDLWAKSWSDEGMPVLHSIKLKTHIREDIRRLHFRTEPYVWGSFVVDQSDNDGIEVREWDSRPNA